MESLAWQSVLSSCRSQKVNASLEQLVAPYLDRDTFLGSHNYH